MKQKQCTKCKELKTINSFHRDSRLKSGLRADCKSCVILRRRHYRETFPDRVKESKHKSYLKHKERILKHNQEYYVKNRDAVNRQKRSYMRRRWHQDPQWKLRKIVSTAIYEALRKRGGEKAGESITRHLPYTIEELKQYLENQFEDWMSWDNWKKPSFPEENTWEIDHITPQCKLLYDSYHHPNFLKCWALSNLRPLSRKKNLKRRKNEDRKSRSLRTQSGIPRP